jgi:hypothetical protein
MYKDGRARPRAFHRFLELGNGEKLYSKSLERSFISKEAKRPLDTSPRPTVPAPARWLEKIGNGRSDDYGRRHAQRAKFRTS